MRIVYFVASSVDGFIATPDGGVEWLDRVQVEGEDYGYAEFFSSIDSMVMGRHTCEKALSFGDWPYASLPCWVMTSQDLAPDSPTITISHESPDRVVADIRNRGLENLWLVGGASLAGAFQRRGLITEYVVSVIPAVLGDGVPLLTGAGPPAHLRLVDSRSYTSGVVTLRYLTEGDGLKTV